MVCPLSWCQVPSGLSRSYLDCLCASVLSQKSPFIFDCSCSISHTEQVLIIVERTVVWNSWLWVEFFALLSCALCRDNDLENALLMQLTHQFLSLGRKMHNFMHETDRTHQGIHRNMLWIDSDESGKAYHRYFAHAYSQVHQNWFFKGADSTQPRVAETLSTRPKVDNSTERLAPLWPRTALRTIWTKFKSI